MTLKEIERVQKANSKRKATIDQLREDGWVPCYGTTRLLRICNIPIIFSYGYLFTLAGRDRVPLCTSTKKVPYAPVWAVEIAKVSEARFDLSTKKNLLRVARLRPGLRPEISALINLGGNDDAAHAYILIRTATKKKLGDRQ